MLSKLIASFAALPDPNCAGRTRHRLLNMLVIAVCVVVAGANTWVDIAHYGRMKQAWLATFLNLPRGTPSHDTFWGVFTLVDPHAGVGAVFPLVDGPQSSVLAAGSGGHRWQDGAVLLRPEQAQVPWHVVSVFATQQSLSLRQAAVLGKGQELTARVSA